MRRESIENNGVNKQSEEEPKSFEWLSGMLAHYVSHFLLLSIGAGKYHARTLEQNKEMIAAIKEKVDDTELISKLDELSGELEKVNLQSPEVDKNLLDNIQKIGEKVRRLSEEIIRAKGIK